MDRTRKQIRVLSFCAQNQKPTNSSGDIKCSLSIVDLADNPQFTALSYVWGPADEGYEIQLNGHPFRVRANLFAALQTISHHLSADEEDGSTKANSSGLSKYFWTDALCINQDDIDERNHQVQMMSTIYKSASLVLVWLGVEHEEALRVIQTADPSALSAEVFDPEAEWHRLHDSDFARKVEPFLKAPYWERMWILQEFILARKIVLASGNVLVPWDHASLMFPPRNSPDIWHVYHHCLSMVNERWLRVNGYDEHNKIQYRLGKIIQTFGGMQCVDPRDRIFALLGFVDGLKADSPDDTERPGIYVDYRLTPLQLAARYLVLATKSAFDQEYWGSQVEGVPLLFTYLPDAMGFSKEELKAELKRIKRESPDGRWLGFRVSDVFKAVFDYELSEMYAEKGWLPEDTQTEYISDSD